MKKQTIKYYTILYQYLLMLKEHLYVFLVQAFQHIDPENWWNIFIVPVLQGAYRETKENLNCLDIADLINSFQMNWTAVWRHYDTKFVPYKYDKEYKLAEKVHYIRTLVSHANESEMNGTVFLESLDALARFAKLIKAKDGLPEEIAAMYNKQVAVIPPERNRDSGEELIKKAIYKTLEEKVLLPAINSESLEAEYKLSVNRTSMRLKSMRTLTEVASFFRNAQNSDKGKTVEAALRKNGLKAFSDINEEVGEIIANGKSS